MEVDAGVNAMPDVAQQQLDTAPHSMHLTFESSGRPFPCCLNFFCDSLQLPGSIKDAILQATLVHSTWYVFVQGA